LCFSVCVCVRESGIWRDFTRTGVLPMCCCSCCCCCCCYGCGRCCWIKLCAQQLCPICPGQCTLSLSSSFLHAHTHWSLQHSAASHSRRPNWRVCVCACEYVRACVCMRESNVRGYVVCVYISVWVVWG